VSEVEAEPPVAMTVDLKYGRGRVSWPPCSPSAGPTREVMYRVQDQD
jgi:hypothetical protein